MSSKVVTEFVAVDNGLGASLDRGEQAFKELAETIDAAAKAGQKDIHDLAESGEREFKRLQDATKGKLHFGRVDASGLTDPSLRRIPATLGEIDTAMKRGRTSAQEFFAAFNRRINPFAGMEAGAIAGLGAAAGLTAVVAGMGYLVSKGAEAETAQVRLRAILRATGYAAELTSKEMSQLAKEMSGIGGYSRSAVVGAQATLAGFKTIKGDEFRDAIKASIDLASAMGVELSAAAEKLGKALADPTKAAEMLRDVHVNLTAAQQEQIKAFMAAGETAKAQRIILDELRKTYGGVAEEMGGTFSVEIAKLKNDFDELGGVALKFAKPMIAAFKMPLEALSWLNDKWAEWNGQEADDAKEKQMAKVAAAADKARKATDDLTNATRKQQEAAAKAQADTQAAAEKARADVGFAGEQARRGTREYWRERGQNLQQWMEDPDAYAARQRDLEKKHFGIAPTRGEDLAERLKTLRNATKEGAVENPAKAGRAMRDAVNGFADVRTNAEKYQQALADLQADATAAGLGQDFLARATQQLREQFGYTSPLEQYAKKLAEIQDERRKGLLSAEEFAARTRKAQEEMFGPTTLTAIQRYRKEIEEVRKQASQGLPAAEAAARSKTARDALLGAGPVDPRAEANRKRQELNEVYRTSNQPGADGKPQAGAMSFDEYRNRMTQINLEVAEKTGAKQVWESTRTNQERATMEFERLATMRRSGDIDADTYRRASNQVSQQYATQASYVGLEEQYKKIQASAAGSRPEDKMIAATERGAKAQEGAKVETSKLAEAIYAWIRNNSAALATFGT